MKALWITILASAAASIGIAKAVDVYLIERISIIGSFIGFERTLNPGIAFGIKIPGLLQTILIFLALFFVAWYAIKDAKTIFSQIGFGLILGGGIANINDRLMDGLVTDFIQVGSFPVFNAADSCITIGIVVLFWEMVVKKNG